jgi:hypothetical protein
MTETTTTANCTNCNAIVEIDDNYIDGGLALFICKCGTRGTVRVW